MWLLIDNYDSFTYILQDYLLQLHQECVVYKNDEITLEEIRVLQPDRIIISPGPETPLQAGISMKIIEAFHQAIPILGVCLGHQAIGVFYGAKLQHAPYPMHGKTSFVQHFHHPIFKNIPSSFEVMRYHSLVLTDLPEDVELIAVAEDDNSIMGIAHKKYPCIGIQFHPESIGTTYGATLLKNWKALYEK
jgi:anthranilate synthase/aminodeoxychorismate synthase-like glutamine amidotransferase